MSLSLVSSILRRIVQQQTQVFNLFVSDTRFRNPVIAMWVESIVGAIREPVLTFHFLELGLSEVEIGLVSTITTVIALFTAPLYGYVQDKYMRGSFRAIALSCLFCTVGCLLVGLGRNPGDIFLGSLILGLGGNVSGLILGHITSSIASEDRALVVAAFVGQQQVLRLGGRLLYPVLDGVLESGFAMSESLMRSRFIVSTCTVGCLFAFVLLMRSKREPGSGEVLYLSENTYEYTSVQASEDEADQVEMTELHEALSGETHKNSFDHGTSTDGRAMSDTRASAKHWPVFFIVSAALVFLITATTTFTVLWPIFIRDKFGWGPHEYALLTSLRGLLSVVSISSFPVLAKGRPFELAKRCTIVAATTGAVAFIWTVSVEGSVFAIRLVHAGFAVALFSLLALCDPAVKSLAVSTIPSHLQGVSWGGLTIAQGFGNILGNTVGTIAYKHSKEGNFTQDENEVQRSLESNGAYWFGICALLLSALFVHVADRMRTSQVVTDGKFENSKN